MIKVLKLALGLVAVSLIIINVLTINPAHSKDGKLMSMTPVSMACSECPDDEEDVTVDCKKICDVVHGTYTEGQKTYCDPGCIDCTPKACDAPDCP